MYQIKLTCYDAPYDEPPYEDAIDKKFLYQKDAKNSMMRSIIEETDTLNQPDDSFEPRTNIFVPTLNYMYNGITYDGAITMWDGVQGIQEQPVTLYKIEWVNENSVDKYNKKLKDRYGESLTLLIKSEMVEDEDSEDDAEIEKYYVEGNTRPKSDYFDTPEEAYKDACEYLDNIGIYV